MPAIGETLDRAGLEQDRHAQHLADPRDGIEEAVVGALEAVFEGLFLDQHDGGGSRSAYGWAYGQACCGWAECIAVQAFPFPSLLNRSHQACP